VNDAPDHQARHLVEEPVAIEFYRHEPSGAAQPNLPQSTDGIGDWSAAVRGEGSEVMSSTK
jgi:hypothetical protein